MKMNKIHHVAIICSNYELSKHFYTEVLGLTVVAETFREERESYKLDLAIGDDYQIELFSFPHPPERINRPEARGLRHLAFEVNDVGEVAAELEARSIAVEPIRIDPLTGKEYTFIADPDGLPIEFVQK
ncbi:SMU1112c/YaeR family gloxylase I-like metalloprotein [Paenibacillus glycinis]|uniref:VOC family protein n=1 Tax=Paenibacillus glycinis TaxID=2697035 RepID=A0ABW9XNN4_9BACL|nr:VOC family protein [Paenibacillus glycinis]NBD23997.1 VOC family protein [Paenibacillus glycinis]